MKKKQQTEPSIVNDADRVSSWLRHATHEQYEDGVSELGDSTFIEPATPPRHPHLPTFYAEASPTDTTFSGCSIFDASDSPGHGWIEDVFGDDVPNATAGDDQEVCFAEKKKIPAAALVHLGIDPLETDSHSSCGSSSEAAETLEEVDDAQGLVAPPLDPNQPRPTWLTSCLQCVYADMPCSRKAPACSRCRRNGEAALCLLHRRPYPEEIIKSDASWSTTLKLLKLKDENRESWRKKLQLADELQDMWRAGNDYKNWVLPPVDSPRGDFRSNRTRILHAYPNEGKGERKDHPSYQELCVVMED